MYQQAKGFGSFNAEQGHAGAFWFDGIPTDCACELYASEGSFSVFQAFVSSRLN